MHGSGFCLYHSLSHCLTGNDEQFVDIIDDCLTVFQNIPDLFRLRTNFGSYDNSSLTLDDYVSYMLRAVQLVQAGRSVDSHAYGDEGHIAAIALLYDITVFTYSMQNKMWYVLNESGRRGYVCLLHLPDHFDVLRGTDGRDPAIPFGAHTQGVNRHNFDTSFDAWQSLQRTYTFQNVFKFPEHYTGVEILNSPVVTYAETSTASSVNVDKSGNSRCTCQCEHCTYVAKSAQGLHMHKLRCHNAESGSVKSNSLHLKSHGRQVMQQQDAVGNCDIIVTTSDDCGGHTEVNDRRCAEKRAATQHVCDFEHCGYVAKHAGVLQLHKNRHHCAKEMWNARKSFQKTKQIRVPEIAETAVKTVTYAATSGICKVAVPSNGVDETVHMYDAESVVSIDSNCSRRSQRIAKKRTAAFTDSGSGCYSSTKARRLSDRNDKMLQHETTSLSGDISRRKTARPYVSMDVEPDNASINSLVSTDSGIRRSVRISNRKSKCEDGKSHTDVSDNVESISKVVKISNRNTQKCDIKKSFSRVISDFERDFIPKNVLQQNDPLHDRLKAYHDDLLKSVSNTTTEKISAEVVDVVENVSLVDSHDRRYQWSLSDQDRLNE